MKDKYEVGKFIRMIITDSLVNNLLYRDIPDDLKESGEPVFKLKEHSGNRKDIVVYNSLTKDWDIQVFTSQGTDEYNHLYDILNYILSAGLFQLATRANYTFK